VLFVVEDLHWIDPSTLEFLTLLVEQGPTARLLTLLTCRPEFQPPWGLRTHLTPIALQRLPQSQVEMMIARVTRGKALPPEVLRDVVSKTDGVPLFVEELTKTVLESGLLRETPEHYELNGPLPPQATYLFKHALIQDAAYQSLLKSTRQQLHQQVAQVLEARFPALVVMQPELVAQHYTAADCIEQALPYWQRAGERASERSAYLEAISHCTTGIELLKTLPETPVHTQQALALHITLGAALLVTKGHAAPEVERIYTQARLLCQQVGETPQLLQVLFGLYRFYIGRPQLHTARELGETLLRLTQQSQDPVLAVVAHYTLGFTWLCLGVLPAARLHLEQGIAHYTPEQRRASVLRIGQELGVGCRAYAAMTLWLLGYPEQALSHIHNALTLAHELSHPYSLAYAWCLAAFIAQFRRDVSVVYEQAEAAGVLSTDQGFPLWVAQATSFRGWALILKGQGGEGLTQIHQGIALWHTTGARLLDPFWRSLLAEASFYLGHVEDGLQALDEALALVEQHEERWWEAEIHRLRGVCFRRQPASQPAEAEACFQRALDIAQRQEAKSLELRAAMSLARLWQSQGKRAKARALLAPIYSWFTEGFDTVDLQEARALLDELV
jgi:predicted ATPase